MAHADSHHGHGGDGHHGHHIVPLKTLSIVFGALVALTIITVLTAKYLDLGVFNVPLALAIAGTKALLVITIFMALKWDNPMNALVFSVGTLFVVVFLVFTLFDTSFRGDINNMETLSISDQEIILSGKTFTDPIDRSGEGAAAAADTTAVDTTAADSTHAEDDALEEEDHEGGDEGTDEDAAAGDGS